MNRKSTKTRQENEAQQAFKVIVLGEARVGKSSILLRFSKNQFDPNSQPTSIGAEQVFIEKQIQLFNGATVTFNLWDTAGQEQYSSVVSLYYKQARAAIVVFDLTDRDSITKAHKWITEVRQNLELQDCKIVLVGNKQDKVTERVVSTQEGQSIANQYSIKYYETSAKSGVNIPEIFRDLSEELYAENRSKTKRPTRIEIQNDNFQKGDPQKRKANTSSQAGTSSSKSSCC